MNSDGDAIVGEPGDDAYVAAFDIRDLHGAAVVSYSPDFWMPTPVDAIEVTFDEPIDPLSFTIADVTVIGPDGPVTPAGVQAISQTVFRVDLPAQTIAGEYTFTLGSDIQDVHANRMDQDGDGANGTQADTFTGTFHILEGVEGNLAEQALRNAAPPADTGGVANVVLSGQVVYGGTLASWFANQGVQVTVMLFEQDGMLDGALGESEDPAHPELADDLVSVINTVTGTGQTDAQGRFIFTTGLDGLPLTNRDADETAANPSGKALAQYYVVVVAANSYAFVVDENSVNTTAGTAAKPWRVPLHPWSTAAGENYGDLFYAPTYTCPLSTMADPSSPTATLQYHALPNIVVTDLEFSLMEWIRYGAGKLQSATGEAPRRVISVTYAWTKGKDHSPNNAQWRADDSIIVGANAINVPGIILHEYGHSLEYSAYNYQNGPYDGGPYGIIQESTAPTTASSEGWASFFAAWTLDGKGLNVKGASGTLQRLDYNRSGQFLESNNFWMGWDAYGFASQSAAPRHARRRVDPGRCLCQRRRERQRQHGRHGHRGRREHLLGSGRRVRRRQRDGPPGLVAGLQGRYCREHHGRLLPAVPGRLFRLQARRGRYLHRSRHGRRRRPVHQERVL